VDQTTVRLLLGAFAFYMFLKTATAPKRGRFLTLFGNIGRDAQPKAFRACLIAGYVFGAFMLLAAIFSDVWLAALMRG
jgi:hypothetical protein